MWALAPMGLRTAEEGATEAAEASTPSAAGGAFTERHRRCLLGCIVYLCSAAHRLPLSRHQLGQALQGALTDGEGLCFACLPSHPRSFVGAVLANVCPRVLPAVLALELYQRLMQEELGRREFLARIARRDEDVAELQFLNVFLSPSADADVTARAAAASRGMRLSGEQEQSVVTRLQASRKAWLAGMQGHIEATCHRVMDAAWRARIAEAPAGTGTGSGTSSGTVILDDAAFPLPPALQATILEHCTALKALAQSRSVDGEQQARAMEGRLRRCVRGVFATIERLLGVAVAWESPMLRRLHYLQRQSIALRRRALQAEADLQGKTYAYDQAKRRDELMRAGLLAYGEPTSTGTGKSTGKSLSISPELRKALEDPDDDGLQPVIDAGGRSAGCW